MRADVKGMVLAAVVALLCALPQALLLPALDRDEARFAQATKQMLQSGDFIDIRFQQEPRYKKPVGIHWLQAAITVPLPRAWHDSILPYRIPSLLGVMLAAASLVWGLSGLIAQPAARAAGLLWAASLTLGIEGAIAKTDAVLTGLTTLALMALVRLFMSEHSDPHLRNARQVRTDALIFWGALGAATLVKGPVPLALCGLSVLALLLLRGHKWLRALRSGRGVALFALILAPWIILISLKTHGAFWSVAFSQDLLPKLAGGQEQHGAPFGLHSLLVSFGLWPASALIPLSFVAAWTLRRQPLAQALMAIFLPGLLMFELMPTKLAHYALPTYAGLLGLCVLGIINHPTVRVRAAGAILLAVIGALLAALMPVAAYTYGGAPILATGFAAVVLAASLFAAVQIWRGWTACTLAALVLCGLLTHTGLAVTAANLQDLWLSKRVKTALQKAGWQDADIVASYGFSEPSLVFALGTGTQLDALLPSPLARYAIVERRSADAFAKTYPAARALGQLSGYDYSRGKPMALSLYRFNPEPHP